VHYYGIDTHPFEVCVEGRAAFRREIGLPEDALILLFAGRIVPEKNPIFVVDLLYHLRKLEPRAAAVFAGAGSQEASVSERAKSLGLENEVKILGWRGDIPKIMCNCDWFVLSRPESPMEGFGLAVIEAQLAGLRLLLSRGIADDPLLPSAAYRRISLAEGPQAWAELALEILKNSPSRFIAFEEISRSPMDMDRALGALMELYL
jgi:glycosyltransferase involved in cell wall biosynthesis